MPEAEMENKVETIVRKELQKNREKLNMAVINPKSSYVPALHQSAELLRSSVRTLDYILMNDLGKLEATIVGLKPNIDITPIKEIESELAISTDREEREDLEAALKELKNNFRKTAQKFNDAFIALSKEVHVARISLDEGLISDRINDAYEKRQSDLEKHIRWANNTLAPLLKQVTDELAEIDQRYSTILDSNPFEKAVELLPKKSIITDIDVKKPEISALAAGYELTLSVLKGMSEVTELIKYIGKHKELRERKNTLQEKYNEAVLECEDIKSQLDEIKQLHTVDYAAIYYFDCTKELEGMLVSTSKKLETGKNDIAEYSATVYDFERYLKSLEIIWR